MNKVTVNKKNIYIVNSHNQVLEAWKSGNRLNVFSLDYHTDTRRAFQNYSYWRADSEVKSGLCDNHGLRMKELAEQKISQYLENLITIEQVNDNLKHDEHLDFAVRTEMIDTVFILSSNSNASSSNPNVHIADGQDAYNNHRIIEFSPPCIPGCRKAAHDEECRTMRADYSIEDVVLDDAVSRAESFRAGFFDNYILDIDCDYFNTERSLNPERCETFKKLIRESEFITIALEPECVKICRHEGCRLISEVILAGLISKIEAACR